MIKIACDFCGEPAEKYKEFGFNLKRQYCDNCQSEVVEYQTEVDNLHEKVVKDWSEGLQKIRDSWVKKNPTAKLPDYES